MEPILKDMYVQLYFTDGTHLIVKNGVFEISEKIDVYLDEYRANRNLITICTRVDGSSNLWDIKYAIGTKRIRAIYIYGEKNDPVSEETSTELLMSWKDVDYVFHGAFRTIRKDPTNGFVNEVHTVLVSDVCTK